LALGLLICGAPACRRQVPLKPYTAYVVNHAGATLAAVNLATFRVTASLPVAPQPERVVVRPGARQLYVVSGTGKISVVVYPRLRLVATLDVGRSAKDLAFSADGRFAYVLNPADRDVVFLDCGAASDNGTPKVAFRLRLEGTPADLALFPDGRTLAVDCAAPNRLTFIGTEKHQPLGSVEIGGAPGPMVVLPDNSKVFVADMGDNKISAVDAARRQLLAHIEIGMKPTALLLKPDGGEIFALAAPASTLVILDTFHDEMERTFPLGLNPTAGIFKPDQSVLFIANAGDGSVVALDVQTRQVLASPHVGMEPYALALTPDQRLLVVADRAASSLALLHAEPAQLNNDRSVLITTVPVGASPVDVVVPDLTLER
jgi:YVTN family beta-propeller protein